MSSFTDRLEVQWISGKTWRTMRDMTYRLGPESSSLSITVPKFTETDFASIPRALWSIVGHPAGVYVQAAVLHDYLYETRALSRHMADAVFYDAMKSLNVAPWRRYAIFKAVRLFGGSAYRG